MQVAVRPDIPGIVACYPRTSSPPRPGFLSTTMLSKYTFDIVLDAQGSCVDDSLSQSLASTKDLRVSAYEPTLLAWSENFDRARSLPKVKYDERFRRMWKYYLRMSAGAFRAKHLQVFQLVMTQAGKSCRAGAGF